MMELMGSKTVLKRYGFVKASRDCTGYLANIKNSSTGQFAAWLVIGVEKFKCAEDRFRLTLHNGLNVYKFLVLSRSSVETSSLCELLQRGLVSPGDWLHILMASEETINNKWYLFGFKAQIISSSFNCKCESYLVA